MNTNTAARTCSLHLTKNCSTCYKFRNECDFGACKRTATHAVVSPAERRGSCAKHIKDLSRNYPAAKIEAAA